MSEEFQDPPEGFKLSQNRGPFTTHNGPFYHKVTEEGFCQGFYGSKHHCNSHGIIHGGLLMTFADGVLATAVWRETKARAVTIRMTSDFVNMARAGEWLEGTAEVTQATKSVAFVEGRITCRDKVILTASGVYKLFRRTGRKE